MVKKGSTTKRINSSSYIHYLDKAEEFFDISTIALEKERWKAVGLNCVHSVISYCDAILAKKGSIRSTSQDHVSSGDLLKTCVNHPQLKDNILRYKRILKMKNLVAYESRNISQTEALKLYQLSERFIKWACDILGES